MCLLLAFQTNADRATPRRLLAQALSIVLWTIALKQSLTVPRDLRYESMAACGAVGLARRLRLLAIFANVDPELF